MCNVQWYTSNRCPDEWLDLPLDYSTIQMCVCVCSCVHQIEKYNDIVNR